MDQIPSEQWVVGFEGDRQIVVSRLGWFRRIFSRPQRFVKRFYQQVYELKIEDWSFSLESLRLGSLCIIEVMISVRFQPTLKFAREHLENIADLGGYIRSHYQVLLQDAAEQELRNLDGNAWLNLDYAIIEQRIENIIQELLALREIQCRSRCTLNTVLTDSASLDEQVVALDPRYRGVYIELQKRRRELNQQLERERCEQEIYRRQLRLQHEERLLELARQEENVRNALREQESERMRNELSAAEEREREQYESELRLREERIQHEAGLNQMQLESELAERNRRVQAMDDVEKHLQKEIEFLALERQRLLLEEEIHDVKIAKAKGLIINAKRRFPLGEDQKNWGASPDAEISQGLLKEPMKTENHSEHDTR
jgi:hypothetical protein